MIHRVEMGDEDGNLRIAIHNIMDETQFALIYGYNKQMKMPNLLLLMYDVILSLKNCKSPINKVVHQKLFKF